MAYLPDSERRQAWAELMRDESQDGRHIGISKPDLRAAIDAIDAWLEDNKASANQALPVAARTGLTTRQKALILIYVTQRRYLQEV